MDERDERIEATAKRLAGALMASTRKAAAMHGLSVEDYLAAKAIRGRLPAHHRDAPVEDVVRGMREIDKARARRFLGRGLAVSGGLALGVFAAGYALGRRR